ncbi:MAG: 50S ribosomal protein L10 [Candidatus Taylorbacteria bacterium]|nr:50S ribosomal protein L10 [Candidatus Taylorbacteria bacterium]
MVAISKQKKVEIVEKLKDIFAKSPAVAFVQFNKLTVANAQALRRKLREAGTGYFVAKKTLIRKSLEGGKVTGELPELSGEVAVAYLETGDDITAPAREVFGFEKKLEKAVKLIGGIFEGAFIKEEQVMALATIPPRQTLYAQFANLVNSPIQRFVIGLSEVAKKKQ